MTPGMIHVVMIDFGGGRAAGIQRAEMMAVATALSIQAQQHFALPPPYGYGVAAIVRVAAGPFDVHQDEWVLGLFEKPDQPGALGYHDESPNGRPFSKLFPLLDKQEGSQWSVTASHELLEMLADPNVAKCAQLPDGTIFAYEVADQCEAQSYLINNVHVSDFCLPPNFEPPTNWQSLKLDWMGLVKSPMQVLPGGYAQYFDPQQGWQQVQHAQQAPRAYRLQMRELGHGRGARRGQAHVVQPKLIG